MEAFDTAIHKNKMFRILKDIYSDVSIAPFLGFKGGTAAMIFYNLSRFSVDLDFDLLNPEKKDVVFKRIEQIAKEYGTIKDIADKRFNLLCVLSYGSGKKQIKIEINQHGSTSNYVLKNHLGVSMLVMVQEDMFANKLMAMNERIGKTSRDIYDLWFFLDKDWPINADLIKQRAELSMKKLLEKCLDQLAKMSNRNILNGLGELLSEPQKDWARAKLRTDTIFLLKARLESLK